MVNLSKIVNRIKSAMDIKADKDFALIIGLSAPDFSKRKKSGTLLPLMINYGISKKVNLHWLLTGNGEIMFEPAPEKEMQVAEEALIYKVEDEDTETADLLSMTREILKSSTDYSASLAANVRSFYHAIKTEKRLNKMEGELTVLKNMFTDLARENEKLKQRLDKKEEYPERKIAVGEK